MNKDNTGNVQSGNFCLIVHPHLRVSTRNPNIRLKEAIGLAEAIGLRVLHAEKINLTKAKPSTLLGKGIVERLEHVIEGCEPRNVSNRTNKIEIVVIDGTLSPVQQRNLERAWKTKVIDRTGLILEIFGKRAQTKEGVLQVELAALVYARSRLVRSWTHLERQRGGLGFIGGPGETQIEADRRMISNRIAKLRRELKEVRRTRSLHRKARQRVPYPIVALVGYTNAGKSTLFNTLTKSHLIACKQLFSTLDPTMRGLTLPSGRRIVLSDTVGFISDLPHELVAAFHATLEEVRKADLILHVRDIFCSDTEEQLADALTVLKDELKMGDTIENGMLEVLNKADLLDSETAVWATNRAKHSEGHSVVVSARTGKGCASLLEHIDQYIASDWKILTVRLDPTNSALRAWLYRHGEVLKCYDSKTGSKIVVRLKPADIGRFQRMSENYKI